MSNRDNFKKIAEDTMKILNDGYYQIGNKKIDIHSQVQDTIKKSKLYKPNDFDNLIIDSEEEHRTRFEVVNETALSVAKRMVGMSYDNVTLLNFASAKNPGGGFLNGSSAQEESLARSSSLYPSIVQMTEMYNYNKKVGTCLYSDYMIYSPSVTVIRNDNGMLLPEPYSCSMITAPAVNAKVVKEREHQNVSKINGVMRSRIEKILLVALQNKADALILGAYGCGVFDNNPSEIVKIFQEYLYKDKRFKNKFKHIVFSVLDKSPNKQLFNIFKYGFNH